MSDTLATLQQALAPKGGMKRIPFPLESYQHASSPLSAKRLLNFYAEQEPSDARTAAALISTPGLSPLGVTLGTGPVHAINCDRPGIIYAVSGTHAYRVTLPFGGAVYTIEDLGDVGTPTGTDYAHNLMATIAVGVNAAVFCVPPNAYTCGHVPGDPLNLITGTFPGASSVAYLDGYFVFTSDDIDAQFFCSLLLDPTAYAALDFAYADGVPNVLRRVVTSRGELWLIGDAALEVWYDAGQADFPFRRRGGGVITYGAVSTKTVALADGSVFWVSGEGAVMRSNNYAAVRISTHAIEQLIRGQGTTSVVSALIYEQDGHAFYCVTYGPFTLCYDIATKVWHERSSAAGSAWLPMSAGQFGDVAVFGSRLDGKVFTAVPFLETDDGVMQQRLIQMPPLWGGTNRTFCSRLEVEMEIGEARNPPIVNLQWSDDGGTTWSALRTMDADRSGNRRKRVYTTRLGSFRQRTFRIYVDGHATLYGVDADISAGAS